MFQRTDKLNYRRTNGPLDLSLLDPLIGVAAYAAKPLRSLRNVWYICIASTAKNEHDVPSFAVPRRRRRRRSGRRRMMMMMRCRGPDSCHELNHTQ